MGQAVGCGLVDMGVSAYLDALGRARESRTPTSQLKSRLAALLVRCTSNVTLLEAPAASASACAAMGRMDGLQLAACTRVPALLLPYIFHTAKCKAHADMQDRVWNTVLCLDTMQFAWCGGYVPAPRAAFELQTLRVWCNRQVDILHHSDPLQRALACIASTARPPRRGQRTTTVKSEGSVPRIAHGGPQVARLLQRGQAAAAGVGERAQLRRQHAARAGVSVQAQRVGNHAQRHERAPDARHRQAEPQAAAGHLRALPQGRRLGVSTWGTGLYTLQFVQPDPRAQY